MTTPRSTMPSFWQLVRKHTWLMVGVFVAVNAVVVTYTATRTPTFMSEAKLYVRIGRESVGLDPTATTTPT